MPGEKAFKSRLARATKGSIRCAPWILLGALAIRLTVRDEWFATAPFFYAFPQPIQAFGWTVLAFIALRQRKRIASDNKSRGCAR